MLAVIPENIEKIKRSQYLTFLNTTPTATNPTWKALGVGVNAFGISYNPQVDTEKWILEDNARNDHTSNQKQASVTQKCYKNDPCFEFVAEGRDKLNYVTDILDIDTWDATNGAYKAKKTKGIIVVTDYMGENAEIQYDLYYDGDAEEGTCTIVDGVPTFTPTASL